MRRLEKHKWRIAAFPDRGKRQLSGIPIELSRVALSWQAEFAALRVA